MSIQSSSSIERRLSMAREVETAVEKAFARLTRLRQAVPQGDDMLKSAFEGKLLSFDGNKT